MLALGIDIGGTSIKLAWLQDGQIFRTAKSAPFSRPDTQTLIQALRAAAATNQPIDFIGVCCPGLLDRASRTITLSVNVPGLVGVPLDQIIRQALGATPQPAILSDQNAAAFDIYHAHNLTGRLLSISMGTGVGASVVDEGKFLHVSGESPGHLGQIDVSLDAHPPIGPDGGAGSLEAYIGAAALTAKYRDPNIIDRLTLADDPIRALIRAIRIAHAVYRPQHVCLTGGVGIRLKHLLDGLRAAIDTNLTRVARPGWTLFVGENDHHAACGVARFAISER
jgi:predicted NBD/HSP70 family sugar kinase